VQRVGRSVGVDRAEHAHDRRVEPNSEAISLSDNRLVVLAAPSRARLGRLRLAGGMLASADVHVPTTNFMTCPWYRIGRLEVGPGLAAAEGLVRSLVDEEQFVPSGSPLKSTMTS
jgi:hypothetical protein